MQHLKRYEIQALAATVLDHGNACRIRVSGHSMLPFIAEGDIVEVSPLSNSTSPIQLGDVVLCKLGTNHYVVHRIARIIAGNQSSLTYETQGNAAYTIDGIVTPDKILGRVITVEHNGKRKHIDTKAQRLAGVLWIRGTPWSQRLLRLLRYAGLCRA